MVERAPTAVRVGPVERSATVGQRRFSGWLTSARSGQLAFTVAGRLDARPVEVGDAVRRGDLLGQVDRKPLRNRVRAATANLQRVRAQLAQAQRGQRRATTLEATGAIATAEAEDAGSAVDILAAQESAAEVEVAEAKRMLAEATLRAPFPAVVARVLAEPGEFVPAGQPVVELSGLGGLELEVRVSEDLLGDLPVGHQVEVALPRLRTTVTGIVAAVGRAAPERGELFPIRIDIEPRADLVPGLSAELALPVGEPEGLSVPVEAVINPGGMHPALFVVREGTVERLEVTVERVHGSRAVLTADLQAGETVVVGGLSGLVPGEPVTVIQ